jgi:hypothetical protein
MRRELMADFAANIVMYSLPFSTSAGRLEEMISEYSSCRDREDLLGTSTNRKLKAIGTKREDLLDAFERGIGPESTVERIEGLENAKKALRKKDTK